MTPILGLVLLVGLVAIASIGIVVYGTEVLAVTEQRAEQERIEGSFVELSHGVSTSTYSTDGVQSTRIEAGDHGAIARTDTGEITLTMEHNGTTASETFSIGTIEYEGDDGTTIAYESGGVFRNTGAETQVISSPDLHYDLGSKTLAMNVYTLGDDTQLSSGDVRIEQHDVRPYGERVDVHDTTFTLRIESRYYVGWKTHFEEQGGDTTVTDYGHLDGDRGYVEVTFGYTDFRDVFDEGAGVVYASDTDPNDENPGLGEQDEIFGATAPANLHPMDDAIEQLLEDPDPDYDLTEESLDTENLADGRYYVDEIGEGDRYEFDLSDGNATLVVEGDVRVGDDDRIAVTNVEDDHHLTIYAGGDLLEVNGEVCVDECTMNGTASHVRFYGPSHMGVDFGPTNTAATFEGLLFVAANEDHGWWDDDPGGGVCDDQQVRMQAGEEFYGMVVAYSACAQADVDFEYDERLGDRFIDRYPEGYVPPKQLTHLNVVEYEVTVENN